MSTLIHVGADPLALPHHQTFEYAVLGRSNAGKSTLLNRMFGQRMAKVSSHPGKTQTCNVYQARLGHWVDLPGLGYAAISKSARAPFQHWIRSYLHERAELSLIIHCMDIRHPWMDWDEWLWEQCPADLPKIWVLTKADRVSRRDRLMAVDRAQKHRFGTYCAFGKHDDPNQLFLRMQEVAS